MEVSGQTPTPPPLYHRWSISSTHSSSPLYTGCPTTYQTRQFFNNSKTNEDTATRFEHEYVRCVRNEKECVCSKIMSVCVCSKIIKKLPGLVGSGTPYSTQWHGEYTGTFTFCIVDDSQSQWPRGLRRGPAAALLQGIRIWIPPGNWCPSLEGVMCCRVESWPLVQRNLTESGVSECDQEALTVLKPWTTKGCCDKGGGIMLMKIQTLLNIKQCCLEYRWSGVLTAGCSDEWLPTSARYWCLELQELPVTASHRVFHLFNNYISCTSSRSSFFPNIDC